MSIETIIFDIDGTLVLLPINWDRITSEIRRVSNGNAKSFLGFLAKYHNSEQFWYIHRILEEEEIRAVNNMMILDDLSNIKSFCNVKKIGFVTMQSRRAAEEIVRRLELDKCLDILVTREYAATRAMQLSIAINKLGVEPRNTLFIGDKIADAIASILNNINAIIVMRNPISMRISDTDYLDEDLEVFGIPIARSLREAIEIAKKLYKI
uniref:HAD family hydrolase n=1 Tax=Ignisphaera aggregans TaxID=334771 RepID=A0A7C5TGM8_9CREN